MTCGVPLEQHVKDLLTAMEESKLGGACENTYRSLIEVAAAIQQIHGFNDYHPVLTKRIVGAVGAAGEAN